jgi:hypothetical protein
MLIHAKLGDIFLDLKWMLSTFDKSFCPPFTSHITMHASGHIAILDEQSIPDCMSARSPINQLPVPTPLQRAAPKLFGIKIAKPPGA